MQKKYACKCCSLTSNAKDMWMLKPREHFMKEVSVLKALKHDNIVELVDDFAR